MKTLLIRLRDALAWLARDAEDEELLNVGRELASTMCDEVDYALGDIETTNTGDNDDAKA